MNHTLVAAFAWAAVGIFWAYSKSLERKAVAKSTERDSSWLWAPMLVTAGGGLAIWSIFCFALARVLEMDNPVGWRNDLLVFFGSPQAQWLSTLVPLLIAIVAAELLRRRDISLSVRRWIAGSIDNTVNRRWSATGVLVFGLPWLWESLSGAFFHYGGLWIWQAIFLVVLWRISRTTAERKEIIAVLEEEPAEIHSIRPDWAQSMAKAGITLAPLTTFRAGETGRPVQHFATEWAEIIRSRGAARLAPEVVEQVFRLVHSKPKSSQGSPPLLMLGLPEDCGELETTATAAGELTLTFGEATLIIVPSQDDRQLARIRKWSGLAATQVQEVTRRFDLSSAPGIWVVDAATLSDWLMENLDSTFASAIGLVVWWNLHEYTGVLAANLWAISRRLDRLLKERGRVGVRTLVTVRQSAYADAQETAFVARLLPYPFREDSIIQVEPRISREQRLYLISGHKEYFAAGAHSEILNKVREAPLVAARASVENHWPTFLHYTPTRVNSDWENFLRLQMGAGTLGAALCDEPQFAGAQIRQIEPSEVLALRSVFSNGGRSDKGGDHHCIGIIASGNPYVTFVLQKYSTDGSHIESSRRMVGSEGNPAIYDRHLLLALNEMPDTETNLTHALVWNQDAIRQTLNRYREQLQTQEVAYLDDSKTRRIEDQYTLLEPRHDDIPPLDTVGSRRDLVRVREAVGGEVESGVRMMVDASRLLIKAYPGCVFYCDGVRYRVDDWSEPASKLNWWVPCKREDRAAASWRLSWPTVRSVRPETRGRWRFGGGGYVLECGSATVTYRERLDGYVNREYNLTDGTSEDQPVRYDERETSFDTKALILSFHASPQRPELHELDAWALALRYVFPVHLGIEPDAIEVVTIDNLRTQTGSDLLLGLAIVDLYPGGIGLVEAILSDHQVLTDILGATADWLRDAGDSSVPAIQSAASKIEGLEELQSCLGLLEALLQSEPTAGKERL